MTVPTRRFTNDDDAAQYWLSLLRDGNPNEKVTARDELASVFERRQLIEEAVELLEGNARAGVTDPLLYTRLAGHYRSLGRSEDSTAAMAHAAMLMNRQQPAALPPLPFQQPPQPVYAQPPVQYIPMPAPAPSQSVVVNNVVTMAAQTAVAAHPPFMVRLLYFIFIGSWFGFCWIFMALLMFPFIVTIPLGIWMLNRTSRAFIL